MTEIDLRLRRPLADLWEDVRIQGLPVWVDDGRSWRGETVLMAANTWWHPHWDECWVLNGCKEACIDLSRPLASDILARRVATAVGIDPSNGIDWHWCGEKWLSWGILTNDASHSFWGPGGLLHLKAHTHVPALADLDPHDDTCLDWGLLGQPLVRNLIAIGTVAVHLTAQERNS